MSIANAAQALASEQEYVRPELEDLTLTSSIAWSRLTKNTSVKATSDRPSRIPTMPSKGGKPRVGDLNGGDLGIGSGPVQVAGQLMSTTLVDAFSYTAQAEYATDSDEKAIENFATLIKSIAPKHFADFLDINLQGNGSGLIGTITDLIVSSGNVTGIVVANANQFLDDQDIDVWDSAAANFITSIAVESSDVTGANAIWLKNPIPTGTLAVGQGLYVSGSPAQANSGVAGFRAYHVGTNTGNWMGVQRSSWPGKYITPTVPVAGALTPQVVRVINAKIELAKGKDAEGADLTAHCNLDAQVAWEQNALLVQRIDFDQQRGDSSMDMLKRNAPTTMGGREMLVNPRATPGYIDFINWKNWFRIEEKPIDYYDVGGQTLFPVYGASGGLTTSMVFYMVWRGQVGMVQNREDAFLSGFTTPADLFGGQA